MTDVSLRSVSKAFAGVPAVRDVNLSVERGEFVVLLGPSGCGKTTTLRMIAGFERPTAGHIYFADKNVTGTPPRLRNIGMVFQNYALFPNMTVGENIGFGLKQRRMDRKARCKRVAELLDLIQLSDRKDAYCSQLSGGQQQRVALARALSFSPQLLLMDEPLGALDLKLRESMQVELRRIQRELQITTILVTHDQHEAMTLADRIVIMAGGIIQQTGSPDELYERPASAFVANFIGRNNLFDGEIVGSTSNGFRVKLKSGNTVDVTSRSSFDTGARVELAVRPEKVNLVLAEASSHVDALNGVIEQRQFLGNVVIYFVKVPWGQTILAERVAGATSIDVGAQVSLSWDARHGALFRA